MRLTIRQRLTLFICLLLGTIMAVFGSLAYVGVKQSEIQSGKEKLGSATLHLNALLNTSIDNILKNIRKDAANDTLVKFFINRSKEQPLEALIAEWTSDPQIAAARLYTPKAELLMREPSSLEFPVPKRLRGTQQAHPAAIGSFVIADDLVYYPVMAPVFRDDQHLGYLVRWRRLTTNAETLERIKGLFGSNADIFLGSHNGSIWTDLNRQVRHALPPGFDPASLSGFTTLVDDSLITSIHRLEATGWLLSVQMPRAEFQQASDRFLNWIILAGLLLLGAGILAAAIFSRQISRPLKQLTSVASNIAAGEYGSTVVHKNRADEIGKLARAFNAMSHEVRLSHKELLTEAEKYKLLFHENPLPMWIMSQDDYRVLDVNQAAIHHYGYTREEFLKLSAVDLRPEEDKALFLKAAHQRSSGGISHSGIWRHKKKNGQLIQVDVFATNLHYRERPARLVVVNDVTEKLETEARLMEYQIAQQKLITQTTISAQEKEREQIGRELHDNINQILASVKLYLELGLNDQEFLPKALDNGLENVKLAISEIRQLSKQLVPPQLQEPLPKIVDDLLTDMSALTQIRFSLNAERFVEKLVDDKIRLMVYRIIQEQVNNIIKHAAATHVQINMETLNENFSLTITDNGKGYDTAARPQGIGLRNIDNRVKFHNGIFRISSRPGAGTKVAVLIPLSENPALSQLPGPFM